MRIRKRDEGSRLLRQGGAAVDKDPLTHGAHGYVPKSAQLRELFQAIDVIAAGGRWFSEAFDKAAPEPASVRAIGADPGPKPLTDRENQVALLLAKSFSNKEAASALGISTKNVDRLRASLKRKLGTCDIAGVIRYVIRQGLLDPLLRRRPPGTAVRR
jgi:DNA-binding NarL/FixJ family response regulator